MRPSSVPGCGDHLHRQPGAVGGEAARGEMVQPHAVLEVSEPWYWPPAGRCSRPRASHAVVARRPACSEGSVAGFGTAAAPSISSSPARYGLDETAQASTQFVRSGARWRCRSRCRLPPGPGVAHRPHLSRRKSVAPSRCQKNPSTVTSVRPVGSRQARPEMSSAHPQGWLYQTGSTRRVKHAARQLFGVRPPRRSPG